ncbi:Motile sperm domain-containing protein 2 [Yamadazyma tenuis]|uniref:MSP domain-containing protein n=1 Tax=Candida tenuis (strain ATCC 10573 / BCRC 21748 / CBS 615 / JCM 9827 / NBRC 10315 / NRRL Y-1498 / VKM Y-70) TaxID=590646 RepID=G3B5X3_CANTC|nr:uncharacterized protein CANTEDRAFT_114620 [Yamadazyma tenuis ATCC 10573]XP_006687427.1 uncharacterized protein CANTEDRAFT_114620 [Yamadazyma tenuis ATCC 10573]EGV63633.1 hypothetical protein CANTEDRAFT_114620 [Yamadazyma tenuis ATCC 10573]EGV63634.1 hypothetical protein CANTEDRAFT_114620 [Yamadazyma tenuis ATCC 10573]WEJ96855.1 Motile sperm domain-containing protein 2 [Yamadazyma tenuis]
MQVYPKQLEFKSDFKTPTTAYLTVKNTSSYPLAFKAKINVKNVYSVKPNIRVVNPQESVNVSFTLPTLRYRLPVNYQSKHQFLIMSLPSDGLTTDELSNNWPELQKKYGDSLQLDKIKVKYVNLNESAEAPAAAADLGVGSPTKLNGKSKRISKFVANGSANSTNGSVAGTAAAGAAVGAAGAVASVGAKRSSGSTSRSPADEVQTYNGAPREHVSQQPSNNNYQSAYQAAKAKEIKEAQASRESQTLVPSDISKEFETLHESNERLGKKLDSIERLIIIALMLLSFILGKSMV